MISTVIRNIICNAVKVSLKESKIEIFLKENENYVKIGVKDYGIGIETENLKKIFSK